jgi:hypothetical protein
MDEDRGTRMDGLCRGRRCFLGDIGKLGARGLGEDRHSVGDIGAEIDAADIDGFQERQSAAELAPGYRDAERSQCLLKFAIGFQDGRQRRGLLIADPDFFGMSGHCDQGRGHEADHAGDEAAQDIGKRWHRVSLSSMA